jgi:nucleotide-binding universal stress UspA family protein
MTVSFRRILIAVDSEPVAAHAADIGVDLARSLGADVALIYVIDSSPEYISQKEFPQTLAQAEQDGKRLLAGFRERLRLQPSALEFVQAGKPATEIAKTAKDWPADLLVIGSHGRGGVQRVLLGSVAEGVMGHAPCPVLVIRANE